MTLITITARFTDGCYNCQLKIRGEIKYFNSHKGSLIKYLSIIKGKNSNSIVLKPIRE